MPLDFNALKRPVPRHAVFGMDGWYVWGASMVQTDDGICHLLFSRWPAETGMKGWVTHSEIGYATAKHPLGPYEFQGVALAGSGSGWDAEVTHNPTVMRFGDRYYLYYMGTRGPGEYWDYRNNQRIGVAVADHPAGPWQRFDKPVIDVTPGSWDALMTSNPACNQGPDGRYYMMYKGVGDDGPMPRGGALLAGMAIADDPLGPFVKHPDPVIVNPEEAWAVEDPFIWYQDDRWYAIIKDFQGYFARDEKDAMALFESSDGIDWHPAEIPMATRRDFTWEDGTYQQVLRLERPQIWFQDGRPAVLFCSCLPEKGALAYNVHIPLAGLEVTESHGDQAEVV